MEIRREDFVEQYCIHNDDRIIYPKYSYREYKNGVYYDLVIEKTAKEMTKQIDICPKPTAEERIAQLEADKEALAQNVYALAEVLEALLGGEEDGQEEPITEDTEG